MVWRSRGAGGAGQGFPAHAGCGVPGRCQPAASPAGLPGALPRQQPVTKSQVINSDGEKDIISGK